MILINDTKEYRTSGIYAIKNKINNKIYIGSAINIYERIRIHRRDLIANKHHSKHLQRSWIKYGSEVFEFYLIEEIEKNSLIIKEQFWMDHYQSYNKKNGYNVSPTAGSCLGIKLTEEHKEKLRQAHLGKITSEETKKKISDILKVKCYWIGKKHSEETKQKIIQTKTGVSQPIEVCYKRNESIRKGGSRQGTSNHKGVSWNTSKNKWISQIKVNFKTFFLGYFDNEEDAAFNYDFHMSNLYGKNAFINFLDKDYNYFTPKRVLDYNKIMNGESL